MTADDLRALVTAAHLHHHSYVMLVDWLVNHADALADLIDAARDIDSDDQAGLPPTNRAVEDLAAALAALEADRGTVAEYEADDRG